MRRVKIVVPSTLPSSSVDEVDRQDRRKIEIADLVLQNDQLQRALEDLLRRSTFVRNTVVTHAHNELLMVRRDVEGIKVALKSMVKVLASEMIKMEASLLKVILRCAELDAPVELRLEREKNTQLKTQIAALKNENERLSAVVRVAQDSLEQSKIEFADRTAQMKAAHKEREATLEMQIRLLANEVSPTVPLRSVSPQRQTAKAERSHVKLHDSKTDAALWAQRELSERRSNIRLSHASRVKRKTNCSAVAPIKLSNPPQTARNVSDRGCR